MTILLSDNIISALGFTTEENYRNVKQGVCGLQFFADRYDIPEPFMASEIDDARLNEAFIKIADGIPNIHHNRHCEGDSPKQNREYRNSGLLRSARNDEKTAYYTKLEKACIVSVTEALKNTNVNPASDRTLFVLSTTKGNIHLLDKNEQHLYEHDRLYLWRSAELIARFFGNPNQPVIVSNACISGATALIHAQRELVSDRYDVAIVVGADVLSKFVITGFQAFKALSQEVCKPFDANRTGLNIGEAVATLIMAERDEREVSDDAITLTAGAIRNDSNHISGPSRTGEGSYLALQSILQGISPDEIAFVCAHGTATPYNDEMESVALTRAGLKDVPVNCLKGFFGHTLGAAGVMESILSVHALKNNTIFKTYGYETPGVTNPLDIVTENRETFRSRCIKMLSGFGGCNVAVLFSLSNIDHKRHKAGTNVNSVLCENPLCSLWSNKVSLPSGLSIKKHCRIVPGQVFINGNLYFDTDDPGIQAFFSALYHHLGISYRRFHKMDTLSKLGFLLSELLLSDTDREIPKEAMGILLFNRSSSLETDVRFQKTIQEKDNFYPSPSDFVYTLPNIVTGEIAIRNKIYGETSFYVLPDFQVDRIYEGVDNMIRFGEMKQALAGWTEVDLFTGEILGEMALFERN